MPLSRPLAAALALTLFLSGGPLAHARTDDAHAHRQHFADMPADSRQRVDFPPPMREHTLANMRDHLQALSEILAALSAGKPGEASAIANARLGMASPSAEGCADAAAGSAAPAAAKAASMAQQMNEIMPEGMRRIGLAMHRSASAFATEANKAAKTGNARPALAALTRVTEQCAACHAAYRM